ETVGIEGKRQIKRSIEIYNLDAIIAVGYRVNSKQATQFRIWATRILKDYISQGYIINPSRIEQNYEKFLVAVEETKKLLPASDRITAQDAMELVKMFAGTWFSLDAYDKEALPIKGATKKKVVLAGKELEDSIGQLKKELIRKSEATEIFAVERKGSSLTGIVGNVLQAFGGKDLYPTIEEKAVHLLYFIVKNHPFIDGNKRSGAFAFVWFLQKANFDFRKKITPEALTALTLLIAESNPKDRERVIGLVLLLLKK
ncbi:MAG: death-on-curing family protein, partial [uncultured bacterium]